MKEKIVFVGVGVVLLLIAWHWAGTYHLREFQGGIGIHDTGFWSYPRYHAQLGRMPMWQDGNYQFNVRGLPSEDFSLSLNVEGNSGSDRNLLESLSSSITVTVTDGDGYQLCSGGGVLSHAARGRDSESLWVLESSTTHASFYIGKCLDLPMKRSESYRINVALKQVDPRTPHTNLLPFLEGGGNELP
jgi:hypothetical protein